MVTLIITRPIATHHSDATTPRRRGVFDSDSAPRCCLERLSTTLTRVTAVWANGGKIVEFGSVDDLARIAGLMTSLMAEIKRLQ